MTNKATLLALADWLDARALEGLPAQLQSSTPVWSSFLWALFHRRQLHLAHGRLFALTDAAKALRALANGGDNE